MFRNAIQRFMFGRYGMDELGRTLLWLGFGLFLVSLPTDFAVVNGLSLLGYAAALFRMLSRNHAARRRENEWYCRKTAPITRRARLWRNMLGDKEHRYFKCPGCKTYLRVPKGKGRISITCRSCGNEFMKDS